MKYHIWDNDNAAIVCATDSRKEAFTAVLNHLIEANASEFPDPIMWPGGHVGLQLAAQQLGELGGVLGLLIGGLLCQNVKRRTRRLTFQRRVAHTTGRVKTTFFFATTGNFRIVDIGLFATKNPQWRGYSGKE